MNVNWLLVKLATAVCLVLFLTGCQGPPSEQAVDHRAHPPLTTLTDAQSLQKEQALQARDQLMAGLISELTASLSENGPVHSIRVCKDRAPVIARSVRQKSGVNIGRTSFRLRNPANRPPNWATQLVEQQVQQEVAVELAENQLGVLSPIRLQATCLLCHGDRQQVIPDVQAALATHYPEDKATGFDEGELRGYFWMEVPAAPAVHPFPGNDDEATR